MTHRPTILYATTVGSSTANFLNGQLAHFQEEGWNVHIVCSPDRDFERALAREGVTGHRLPMVREISIMKDIVALVRWIFLIGRVRPEVINVGTPKAALLGSLAAKLWRVPLRIYTVRGLRFETESGRRKQLLKYMEWVTLWNSSLAVAVSASVREVMLDNGLDLRPVAVIGLGSSNGVTLDSLAGPLPDRFEVGLRRDAFVIGFVGRLHPAKGADTLVSALSGVESMERPIEILLIGESESENSTRDIENLSLPVRSTGWVDDARPYYPLMDVLCLPTRREGFPNVVLEAAVAGVPTITTTATGAIDSVVDRETGLLVPPGDPKALRSALCAVYDDPEFRKQMGIRARDRARSEFPKERIWQGLAALYLGMQTEDTSIVAPGSRAEGSNAASQADPPIVASSAGHPQEDNGPRRQHHTQRKRRT